MDECGRDITSLDLLLRVGFGTMKLFALGML